MLGVNAWDEPKDGVEAFVKENKLAFRILLGGRAVALQYGTSSVPTLLWIDRTGMIVDTELGFHGARSLEKKTKRLLAGSS